MDDDDDDHEAKGSDDPPNGLEDCAGKPNGSDDGGGVLEELDAKGSEEGNPKGSADPNEDEVDEDEVVGKPNGSFAEAVAAGAADEKEENTSTGAPEENEEGFDEGGGDNNPPLAGFDPGGAKRSPPLLPLPFEVLPAGLGFAGDLPMFILIFSPAPRWRSWLA